MLKKQQKFGIDKKNQQSAVMHMDPGAVVSSRVFPSKFTDYHAAKDRLEFATTELTHFMNGGDFLNHVWHSAEREVRHPDFMIKLQNFLSACGRYADAVTRPGKFVFADADYQYIITLVSSYIVALQSYPSDTFATMALNNLSRYLKHIKYFKENETLDCSSEEARSLLLRVSANISVLSSGANGKAGELIGSKVIVKMGELNTLMLAKNSVESEMFNILSNIEYVLLKARGVMLIRPSLDIINDYLKMNRDLLNLQICLLDFYSKTPSPKIPTWPFLNRDLLRIQQKENKIKVEQLLASKQRQLELYEPQMATDLVGLIEVILKSEIANDRVRRGEGSIDENQTLITKLHDTMAFKQNALVRFLILAATINCYSAKYSWNVELTAIQRNEQQKDTEKQIGHLQKFVDNFSSLKPMLNEKPFKFFNSFLFIKNDLHSVISATELAIFNCESIFKNVSKNNLQLRNCILEMQIKLLEIQCSILRFAKNTCGEEAVNIFYFRNAQGSGLLYYNLFEKNKALFDAGNSDFIILGIPIDEIIAYSSARKLKLEAIPLEFLAKQRQPQEADYEHAISDKQLERHLKRWEKKAAREKALEEKRPKALTRREKLRKTAAKEVEKAKAELRRKGESSDKAVATNPTVKPAIDPLTQKMNDLISSLNSRVFNALKVKQVIAELHPIILNPDNSDEYVFKALSAIGDCYSMIAGYYLNRPKKNPKELLVNLELAINYYSRAELTLDKHSVVSMEKFDHYYTWLHHSVSIQRKLLDEYVRKFTHQYAQLLASKEKKKQEIGEEEWKKNHLKPGWKKSPKTLQTEALQDALNAVKSKPKNVHIAESNAPRSTRTHQLPPEESGIHRDLRALQNKCRELEEHLQEKIHLIENQRIAYSFEHYLDHAGLRELPEEQLHYKFVAPQQAPEKAVVEAVAMPPDAQGIVDVLPMPKQQDDVAQVTFAPVVNLNPYGDLRLMHPSDPIFMFPYLVMPSALSQSSTQGYQLSCENDLSYVIQGWAPQLFHEEAPGDDVSEDLPSAYQPQYAHPRVVYPYQPPILPSYVPPFAYVPAHYPVATASVISPLQTQITYVQPQVTNEQRLVQSSSKAENIGSLL